MLPGRWTIVNFLVTAIASFLIARAYHSSKPESTESNSTPSDTDRSTFDLRYHLGGYGPYVVKAYNLTNAFSTDLPASCRVEQIHMLARHAERYPTVTAGMHMLDLYNKIADINSTTSESLAFTRNWTFFTNKPASDFEQLTSTGQYAGTLTAFRLGVQLRTSYPDLVESVTSSQLPLRIWASDCPRVIDTAKYFSQGLAGLDWQDRIALEIIPETEDQGADTLTPGDTCLKYTHDADEHGWNYGSRKLDEFLPVYLNSTRDRLMAENPGVTFSVAEMYVMQELCAFELQAAGRSPWCNVFTQAEWSGFEYARDVLHYYRSGPGNPYSGTMGWLWLNATAELLKQGADAGKMFLSFVHDGDIIPMLTALDLFPQTKPLPTSHIDQQRTWRISDTVPMGARVIFELLTCDHQDCWDNGPLYPNHVYCNPVEQLKYVRVIVNERTIPIPGCSTGPGMSCPLSQFLAHVKKRGVETGDYAAMCGLAADAPKRITFLRQP